ncbi:collagen alpha-1(XXIII) chain-like isoform X2 [Oscarella lobularis]
MADALKGNCIPKGRHGKDGQKGEQGTPGKAGPKGDNGLQGPAGLQGDKGQKGNASVPGAEGERGPIGPKGERGPIGPKGKHGPIGPKGERGPIGPKGENGLSGAKGQKGEAISCQMGNSPTSYCRSCSNRQFTITFGKCFGSVPNVITSLNVIDSDYTRNLRINSYASHITRCNFVLNIYSWFDTIIYTAQATWIACPL